MSDTKTNPNPSSPWAAAVIRRNAEQDLRETLLAQKRQFIAAVADLIDPVLTHFVGASELHERHKLEMRATEKGCKYADLTKDPIFVPFGPTARELLMALETPPPSGAVNVMSLRRTFWEGKAQGRFRPPRLLLDEQCELCVTIIAGAGRIKALLDDLTGAEAYHRPFLLADEQSLSDKGIGGMIGFDEARRRLSLLAGLASPFPAAPTPVVKGRPSPWAKL